MDEMDHVSILATGGLEAACLREALLLLQRQTWRRTPASPLLSFPFSPSAVN